MINHIGIKRVPRYTKNLHLLDKDYENFKQEKQHSTPKKLKLQEIKYALTSTLSSTINTPTPKASPPQGSPIETPRKFNLNNIKRRKKINRNLFGGTNLFINTLVNMKQHNDQRNNVIASIKSSNDWIKGT